MNKRNLTDFLKNTMGTVFLLAGAFFVCSTLLSMRAVFADPIAPTPVVNQYQTAGPRTTATARDNSRPTVRGNLSAATVSRATAGASTNMINQSANNVVSGRGVQSRAVSARTATTTVTPRNDSVNESRVGVTNTATRNVAPGRGTATRNVISRGTTTGGATRNVVARTATNPNASRVSLSGTAIRGSSATTSTAYTYLQNKLYTGNYANIIDSTTGMISAEAYSNCMESYYTCMDEICTARNTAQRRCACAGRVKAFSDAEQLLESANEELIKVSGELALLIATKGKDVSAAFKLTDAEKIMNCAAYVELVTSKSTTDADITEWCDAHPEYSAGGTITRCSKTAAPTYCSQMGNTYGFTLADFGSNASDILAAIRSWVDAKDKTMTITQNNNDNLFSAYDNMNNLVGSLTGVAGMYAEANTLKDSLAETWGYELFEYAHNNVCGRVLDTCFNGIYEACGSPTSTGRKCSNGASQCPFNYNSTITVDKTSGEYNLNFITANTSSYTASNSATCFGYTSASGDPYSSLRGPVADARRSIMQKYALDANADCDLYGEQLRTAAQNVSYQKVAAQQALQQKRLEFYQEEVNAIASNYSSAINNFNECLSELYDCYTTQATSYTNWSTSRIKTYCSQISNAPHCYETMICSSPNSVLQAVIDIADDGTKQCNNTQDYATNTCRNIVTISEVLSGSYASGATTGSAVQLREACLQNVGITGIRNWTRTDTPDETNPGWAEVCPSGYIQGSNGACFAETESCTPTNDENAVGTRTWNTNTNAYGTCTKTGCRSGYAELNGKCVPNCQAGMHLDTDTNTCVGNGKRCTIEHATSAMQTWDATKGAWGDCLVQSCAANYQPAEDNKSCVSAE